MPILTTNNQESKDHYIAYNTATHSIYDTKPHAVYNKSTHIVLSKREHTLLERDQLFVSNLIKSMTHKKFNLISEHTKSLIGAFASSHPQVSPNYIELCIALARYTLPHDIRLSSRY